MEQPHGEFSAGGWPGGVCGHSRHSLLPPVVWSGGGGRREESRPGKGISLERENKGCPGVFKQQGARQLADGGGAAPG
jgi:hypothetical protein